MMNFRGTLLAVGLLAAGLLAGAQSRPPAASGSFEQAANSARRQLEESLAELAKLREAAAAETIPLSRRLSELEKELVEVRLQHQATSRALDSRTLDLGNLRSEIRSRQEEISYLSNLLGEYARNFEARLHIAELRRYREPLEAARLAPEDKSLSELEIFAAQAALLAVSLDRLEENLGGARFPGTAVDGDGRVREGSFVLLGPAAIFQSRDGESLGVVQQRLGSLEPTVVAFRAPEDASAAAELFARGAGSFPLDPSLGNAHKIEQTRETLIEHIKKGGPVMVPIFALAGAALLVALFKWLSMFFIPMPSQKSIRALLAAVAERDEETAKKRVKAMRGPVGKMLAAGIEHLRQPRELLEEVMYEKVLATRLKLERLLPFIAIAAASAPLLGLLGTVTGIINTFKLITVFGSGDVKTLSGGISEALITTEYGLIVAIPSLLIHAFLSRKARGVVNQMEKAAVALVNQVGKTPVEPEDVEAILARLSPQQLEALARQLGGPREPADRPAPAPPPDSARDRMDARVVSVGKAATVAETVSRIQAEKDAPQLDCVFVVDEDGRYVGRVRVQHLLNQPREARVEPLADKQPLFVRIDAPSSEAQSLFGAHDLASLPVLNHEDQLVGRLLRETNGNGKGNGK